MCATLECTFQIRYLLLTSTAVIIFFKEIIEDQNDYIEDDQAFSRGTWI